MSIVNANEEQIAKELTLAALDKGLFGAIKFSSDDTPESYNVKVGNAIGVLYDQILNHVISARKSISNDNKD
nr:hypothetical protein [uncultured Cellulosilyticum sp.]